VVVASRGTQRARETEEKRRGRHEAVFAVREKTSVRHRCREEEREKGEGLRGEAIEWERM
jgi:hypothetical protein